MNKKKKIVLVCLIVVLSLILLITGLFAFMISPVDSKGKESIFTVESGESYSTISDELKSKGFIRNEIFYKIYIKLANPKTIETGTYLLSPSMSLCKIIKTFENGAVDLRKTISITFVEGKNMRYVIKQISDNFKISEDDILAKIKNTEYLDYLISKYWFLSDEIKNENIYYSLEGYLFPDTYEFYTDSLLEEIFEKMLNNTSNKLNSYKSEIDSSEYSYHEMLTLASIIEQEASNSNDRKGVAGVFYNRLNDSWSLGSDVTTYYAEKLELWSRDLYAKELKNCNSYNTRATCMVGKLPVGPICNPSLDSIIASIEPETHKYYYFVADAYGETYFNETSTGHTKTVSKLKSEGKWFEY